LNIAPPFLSCIDLGHAGMGFSPMSEGGSGAGLVDDKETLVMAAGFAIST
jgi:hypothetical protein